MILSANYLRKCANADILASSEIPSAAVQWQASVDVHGWSLSSLTGSNVLRSVMD